MAEYRQKGSAGYLFSIVLVAVIGGLLFGYDTAVISGAEKGLQSFFQGAKDFTYTNALHGFTTSSALIGCVIGALLSGIMASGLGRKKSLFIAGILFLLSALGSYYPEFLFFQKGVATKSLLVAFNGYRILGGIGVGLASALCPMYIAEIAPARKRGALVSWNQFAIIFGQLVVYFVNYLIVQSHVNDPAVVEWTQNVGWRVMFVSEAVPAGLFALLILLIPETPRYLALNGEDEKALTVLSNINGEKLGREILANIKATAVEKKERLFAYGPMVIFIGCMLSVFQQIIGINAVLYFAPRIFESMGDGPDRDHGCHQHHLHPRRDLHRRENRPQTVADHGFRGHGHRRGAPPAGILRQNTNTGRSNTASVGMSSDRGGVSFDSDQSARRQSFLK